MKTDRISFIPLSLLTLVIVWVAGCASTASRRLESESLPPPPSLSIVLLRLTPSVDGKPADPFAGKSKVAFRLANLETGQSLGVVRPVPVGDVNFAKSGWVYLLLAPGTYRVEVVPLSREQGILESLPYRLYMPAGHPLLYAGSLQTTNSIRISLCFEPEAAQTIAQTEFKAVGSLTLAELRPVDGFVSAKPFSQLGETVIVTRSSQTVEPPRHLVGRMVDDFIAAAITPPDPFGMIAAYDLAAAPISALAGTIAGTISQKKWSAIASGMSLDYANLHPESELATAIFEQAQSNGITCLHIWEPAQNLPAPSTTNAGVHVLSGEIRAVRAVKGPRKGLAGIEITLHFRILDTQADNCLYDHEFSLQSELSNKKAYRGTPGRTLFSTQLTGLINTGVEQFLHDVIPPLTAENAAEPPIKQ